MASDSTAEYIGTVYESFDKIPPEVKANEDLAIVETANHQYKVITRETYESNMN